MIINKITNGYVVQQFDTELGKYINQEFIAGDPVEYEQPNFDEVPDEELELIKSHYLPFNMVQPE